MRLRSGSPPNPIKPDSVKGAEVTGAASARWPLWCLGDGGAGRTVSSRPSRRVTAKHHCGLHSPHAIRERSALLASAAQIPASACRRTSQASAGAHETAPS